MTRYTASRRLLAVVRYAKATFAPTPTEQVLVAAVRKAVAR